MLRSDRCEDTSYRLAGLLVLVMGGGPLVLYAVTALAPLVLAELGLSRADLGALAGVTFLTAAVCSALGGRFVDHGNERTITVGVLVGADGGAGPRRVRAAAGVAPRRRRGLRRGTVTVEPCDQPAGVGIRPTASAGGIHRGEAVGVQLGQLVAGALLPSIAAAVGWRIAVACAALIPGFRSSSVG